MVLTTCGKVSYRLANPGLSKEEAALDMAVELGLDQVAQHVGPCTDHKGQIQWHHSGAQAIRPAHQG